MKLNSRLFVVLVVTLVLNAAAFSQSRYTQFGNLNNGSINVTATWAKLNTTVGTHTFTKNSSSTRIEVYVNSRFGIGALSGARGVQFRVRVDNTRTPDFDNMGSILESNTNEFLSLFAVYESLPAGNHTVSIWAQAPGGSATSVLVDPGGWGGKIIVKETP